MTKHTEGNEPSRYDIQIGSSMSENKQGDWILYEDVKDLTTLNAEMLAALKIALHNYSGMNDQWDYDIEELIKKAEGGE